MSDEIDLSHVEIQDHNELMEYIRILLEKIRSLTALYNDNLTLLNDHNEAANAHVDIRTAILDNANEADTKLDNLRSEINDSINVINSEIDALENRATDIEGVNNVQNDRLDSAEYDLSLKIYDSAVSGVGHTGDFNDLLYRPNIVIKDADGSNSSAAVKLSKNRTDLKLPSTIKANIVGNVSGDMTGNAATATKLKTARSINGTNFDGSSNITTANWGTARNISIQDHNAGHTGRAVSVNGSDNVTLKLPSTINADVVGYLTGNISGSAGSVAWSNVSGRPTALSQFTNDSGFITSENALPVGSYIQFAGRQAPAGFLVCNGGAISRTTYSALFAVIGTTYGSGNGSTTFNLPNLTNRFLQGSGTSGTVKNAGLPNITAVASEFFCVGTSIRTTGAMYQTSASYGDLHGADDEWKQYSVGLGFAASRSNPVYGNSTTVQPPALTCLICIKY